MNFILYQNESAKDLRQKLYKRQCKLHDLKTGHESVCLPGRLVRLNPRLLK